MARYTDIDKLIAEYDRVHIGPPGGARKLMEDAPIADVVPREEYEALQINLKTVRYELRSLKTCYEELHYKYQIAVSDGYNKLIVELKEKHTKGGEQ